MTETPTQQEREYPFSGPKEAIEFFKNARISPSKVSEWLKERGISENLPEMTIEISESFMDVAGVFWENGPTITYYFAFAQIIVRKIGKRGATRIVAAIKPLIQLLQAEESVTPEYLRVYTRRGSVTGNINPGDAVRDWAYSLGENIEKVLSEKKEPEQK